MAPHRIKPRFTRRTVERFRVAAAVASSVAATATVLVLAANPVGATEVHCPTSPISAGSYHSLAILTDGSVAAWGRNVEGEIGDGTFSASRPTATQVPGLSDVVAVGGGSGHSLAVESDGSLWSWGWNALGQLGDGTTTNSAVPLQISGVPGIVAIAVGNASNLALDVDGSVWAWGYNQYGQLGDGTTASRPTPARVSGLPAIVAIAAGQGHSVAVGADGSVWAWGANVHGQIGDGTTTQRARPVQVPGMFNIVAVAAGDFHTFALSEDGTVYGWGDNGNGELGIGTTNPVQPTPVVVPIPEPVNSISAGHDFSTAVTTIGSTYAWGLDSLGELGLGTAPGDTASPTKIPDLQAMLATSSKANHTLALRYDGKLYSWGSDGDGESGMGTDGGDYTTPVEPSIAPVALPCGAIRSTRRPPPPLLLVHGINDNSSDKTAALNAATTLIPELPGYTPSTVDEQGGVWQHADVIAQEASDLIASTGQPRVDVIAHSKGGLDTRAAMWQHPERFRSLGMLATPNGGSVLADVLCDGQLLPTLGPVIQLIAGFGRCLTSSDGLFDLQTSYVNDVFNQEVRDHPEHLMAVAAGNCNAGSGVGCIGTAYPFCSSHGGDGTVCVDSAFRRSTANGGSHIALDPVFDGLSHTDMRQGSCPISRVLAAIYGGWNVGNPWITGDGTGCESLASPASPSARTATARAQDSSNASGAIAKQARTANDAMTASAPSTQAAATDSVTHLVVQQLQHAAADAVHPFTITLDPEAIASDARVQVLVPPGTIATITPRTAAGTLSTATINQTTTELGTRFDIDPDATTSSLLVSVNAASEIVTETLVPAHGVELTASVTPNQTGPSTITASLSNAVAGPGLYHAQARYWDGSQIVAVDLADTNPLTTSRSFTAQTTLPRGELVPINVTVTGPTTRAAMTTVVLPDGTATFGSTTTNGLVDTDGDGKLDAIDVSVQLTTTAADTYHIAADGSMSGTVITSVTTTSTLAAGTNVVHLDIPVRDLASRGVNGTLKLTNARLSRGTDTRKLVTTAADLGTVGTYDASTLPIVGEQLTTPVGSSHDDKTYVNDIWVGLPDGRYDRLHVDLTARVGTSDAYELHGLLIGPSGAVVTHVDQVLTLYQGNRAIAIDIDGKVIDAHGTGHYTLTDLSLRSLTDPARETYAPPLVMTLTACGNTAAEVAAAIAAATLNGPQCYGSTLTVP